MVIVTGGAGFIGSCFLWMLNKQGIRDIIVVDNLGADDKWKNLSGKEFHDYIHKDDFLSLIRENRLPGSECVVHLGACSSTINHDAGYMLKNNYEYSKEVLKWAMKNKARFIYASSAATYGDGSRGYEDSMERLKDLRPMNIYGYSKHLFDLWILKNKLFDKVTGFKFFNVFGPNEYHKGEMRSVICKKFGQIRDQGKITLFKSAVPEYKHGEQRRDFVYVKDAVGIMYYFFSNPGKTGIFNLGTGMSHTWNELALAMFSALGEKPNIEYVDMPVAIKDKYQYFTQADMKNLKSAGCDWTFTDFEKAVNEYVGYLGTGSYL